jgi:lipid-binding SYLF domain-containing protein
MVMLTAAVALLTTLAGTTVAVSPSQAQRLQLAAATARDIRAELDDAYWNRARCVVVIPELKKAAFIVGGEYGKGVMSCRAGDGWSAPVFMQLAKGSWGFQAGVEQVDLVMLVMNERGVQKLLDTKTTLGADASVAAGLVGRRAAAATDALLTAEILSYSRARGLFAGIDLSGGVLRPDEEANVAVYGPGAEPRTLLASRAISAPPEATPFLQALGSGAAATAPSSLASAQPPAPPTAGSVPATPRTTTMPTTDDDLRARIVDIQQTLDRILADTTPAPTGTSGATPSTATATAGSTGSANTVTVDRATLLHLRQQLEQLIAALNRR